MNYPDALRGIKKIYTSEILLLLAGLLGGMASVFGVQATQQIAENGAEGLDIGTAFGVMIPVLASGIIAVIATIIEFFGLKDASNENEYFKNGYIYAIIGLILSIALSILSYMKVSDMVSDLGKLASNFIQMVVTFYVITGIKDLAEKLGDMDMVSRGKKTFNIYAAAIICASLVELAVSLLQDNARTLVVGILGAVTLILMIVGYALYLIYLSKAKKMLA